MEVVRHDACKESLIFQCLLVEIVDHEKYLDDILLDNLRFERGHLRTHLRLQKLHQDREHVLVLVAVRREFDHDLASEYHRAFAESILNVGLDFEVVGSFLGVQSVVAQVDEAPDFKFSKEMVD